MRVLLAALVLLLAAYGVESAGLPKPTAWTCSYSSHADGRDAVVIDLIREGGVLKLRDWNFMVYRILEDNDVGLVAVRTYAEESDKSRHLGADVLVIDKKTLAFHKSNVFAKGANADNTPHQGKCVLAD